MRSTVTQFARESVGLCPLRGSYVREFELSHSNPVSRINNNKSCTQFASEDVKADTDEGFCSRSMLQAHFARVGTHEGAFCPGSLLPNI